jgi:hypothetical protein
MGCCGNSAFNYDTQICCQGVVRPILYGYRTYCCGNRTYDYSSERCCYANSIDADGVSTTTDATLYNNTLQMCCDGVVMPRLYDHSSQCCGATVYNVSSSMCCRHRQTVRLRHVLRINDHQPPDNRVLLRSEGVHRYSVQVLCRDVLQWRSKGQVIIYCRRFSRFFGCFIKRLLGFISEQMGNLISVQRKW